MLMVPSQRALLRLTLEHGEVAVPLHRPVCCAAPKSLGVQWPGLLLFSSSQGTYSFPLRLCILSIWTCEEALWALPRDPVCLCPFVLLTFFNKGPAKDVKSLDFCSLEQLFSVSATSWPWRFGRWQASHFAICPSIWVCLYFLMIKLWLLIWRQSPTEVMVISHFSIFDGIR